MPSAHETAYPRLKASVTVKDLAEVYTPTAAELALACGTSRTEGARFGFLVLLKTFQRLGYFVLLGDVPQPVLQHISGCLGVAPRPNGLLKYDESGTRRRHIPVIRKFLEVKPFDARARTLVGAVVREAALTKEDLVDFINISIEELVRNRFELPGFTTLLKEARRGRSDVHRVFYRRVAQALGDDGRDHLDRILKVDDPRAAVRGTRSGSSRGVRR